VAPAWKPEPARRTDEGHAHFELIDDDDALIPASPEVERGLREIAEFEKDRREYKVAGESGGAFFSWFWSRESRPAGWLTVKWRGMVTSVLKLLRWIDAWAYLISTPFVALILFGLALPSRGLVHAGAIVVVLANYGRFWTDLLALFVRPFKDGPLQGVAFLFPPYTLYYLATRWNQMKPILRRMLTSCIPIVLVILAYAFFPSVNPAVKDVQGVIPKLEVGTKELVKEIESVPQQLKDELPLIEKTENAEPESKPQD
jgi:hypothetical protein